MVPDNMSLAATSKGGWAEVTDQERQRQDNKPETIAELHSTEQTGDRPTKTDAE